MVYITVNYLQQDKAFKKRMRSNPISAKAERLYNRILDWFNENGNADQWPETLQIKNNLLIGLADLESSSTFDRCRRELIEHGLISYTPEGGSGSGYYKLVKLYKEAAVVPDVPGTGADTGDSGGDPVGEDMAGSSESTSESGEKPAAGIATPPVIGLSNSLSSSLFPTHDKQSPLYISKLSENENRPPVGNLSLLDSEGEAAFECFKASYPQKCLNLNRLVIPPGFDFDKLRQKVSESDFLTSCHDLEWLIRNQEKVFSDCYKKFVNFPKQPQSDVVRPKDHTCTDRTYTDEEWAGMTDNLDEIEF